VITRLLSLDDALAQLLGVNREFLRPGEPIPGDDYLSVDGQVAVKSGWPRSERTRAMSQPSARTGRFPTPYVPRSWPPSSGVCWSLGHRCGDPHDHRRRKVATSNQIRDRLRQPDAQQSVLVTLVRADLNARICRW